MPLTRHTLALYIHVLHGHISGGHRVPRSCPSAKERWCAPISLLPSLSAFPMAYVWRTIAVVWDGQLQGRCCTSSSDRTRTTSHGTEPHSHSEDCCSWMLHEWTQWLRAMPTSGPSGRLCGSRDIPVLCPGEDAGVKLTHRTLQRAVAAGAHRYTQQPRGPRPACRTKRDWSSANHHEYSCHFLRFDVSAACQVHGQAAVPPGIVKDHATAATESREPLGRRFSASAPAAARHHKQ
jgi:hypothetical protein